MIIREMKILIILGLTNYMRNGFIPFLTKIYVSKQLDKFYNIIYIEGEII